MNLRFGKNFADEVNCLLHPKGDDEHHDCRANDVSSRGDVEQQVLAWLGSRQNGWRLQVMFEVLKRLICLLCPLELVMVLEQLEEG
jgi:hypothetical protein